ncbi:hypothetical protein BC940DRAFT_321756 [Gongronella butleri]|nr:hypothetical protein BC940DRAFT_321756 [Gongronella butleri]
MNDSNTIYIAHHDEMPDKSVIASALADKIALPPNPSKTMHVKSGRINKTEHVDAKSKELDLWKRAVLQLKVENDALRKTVQDLQAQLQHQQQQHAPPQHSIHPHQQEIIAIAPIPISSPCLSSFPATPTPTSPIDASKAFSMHTKHNTNIANKPTLSKREKRRLRMLEDEKLYKNDDLEPIQLHCPSAYTPIQPSPVQQEDAPMICGASSLLPTTPPSSVVTETSFDFTTDHNYSTWIEDDLSSSSSPSSCDALMQ